MCSRECGKHFNGCVKVSIFFNSPIVRRRWVCLSEEGWVQPLFCFVLSTFSISHGQGDRRMILQEFFSQQVCSTGIDSQKAQQGVWFIWDVVQCLNHWEYLLWEKGLGTKLYDGKSVLKMWKCPYGLKKHLAKNWKCCFLFIWPSSVALMKVRTSQADVFIEVDHQVQRMGLLVVAC